MAVKWRVDNNTNITLEGIAGTGLACAELSQLDTDEPFLDFSGTSAADQTKSISTVNGDGVVTGPKDFAASAGWAFAGMIRIEVNGADKWIPFYDPDLS